MDYDDSDFQNQNLHLAGEANTKFPPVSLPRFDFDEHLRFDSLVETEAFLGIEGNEDSNWIEDFSRASSGVVFSSAATESCAISRHTNVWSEATSSESVEMLLNSVGQDDQVIVREKDNSIRKSGELGCTMDQFEPGLETILSKEETPTNPSVDDTPGDSCKTDAAQEQVPLKDDSPTLVEEEPEDNAILASNTAAVPVEVVDTACHDKIGTETTHSLLDQTVAENNAVLAHVSSAGLDSVGTETTDSVHNQTLTEEASMEENSVVLPSDTGTVEAVDTGGHANIRTETTDSLLDQTEDEANTESRMEIDCSHGTVQTGVSASGELNNHNQTTLLPEVFNDENDISDHTAKSDLKDMELSDVTVLERGDQALSALEVAEPDVSGTQCQDLPVSSANTSATVEASLELTGVLPNTTSSEHESTFQTQTHTEILRVETSESVNVSLMDSMVESTYGDVSTKGDNKEGSARISYLKQSMELAVNANDRDQDAKSSQVLSESFVSESVGYVSRDSASKLVESNSQSDTIPKEIPGTMIDIKECEAFPLKPEESQHLSQDGASAVSLTASVDLHMVTTSSEANEQVNFSVTEKVLSGEPENCQTVSPVEASNSGIHIAQQPSKHTEDTQQSTQFLDGCPTSEGSKDAVDADAAGQVLPQQCEETILEKNLTEVVNVPETRSILDKDALNENSKASSLANLRSEAVADCQEEDKTAASGRIMTSATSVSYPAGTMIDGKECEAFPLKPEESQHLSQDGAPAVSLTSSVDLHMVTTSSEANEQVNFSVTEKVLSGEPENCQTVPPVEASNSGSPIVQQPRKQTENPRASSLAKTATGGIKTVATPVSHPTGGVIEVGVSCASTSSEPFVKSHVTGTENAATDLGSHVISSPARKMTELQLNKTEEQNTLSLMATESPALDRNPTSSSGLNLTSDPRKAVEISKTTLVSPMVVGSLSKSSLEKTAAKSSKTKSERKPRRTPKSAGKETSRKGNSVKGAAPFQHFQSAGQANAVNQSSGSSIQITHSTEKQQSLQTPVLNSFGTLSAPTTSLPDMNSTAPSSIFRRPFTDSQQVQLRAQIFVYGGLIQGTAPDEAYMISAFGGADGGRGTWEKAWRACAVRAQRMRVSSPETPLQSRAGKTETPSMSHTSSKVSSATKPIIPLSSPLWSLSTPLETLQSRSIQRGSAAAPLPSSSHAHQAASVTNIGHNTAWMSPLPYPNPWLASPQTSGFDVGSRFPVFPITESVKLTPTKESSLPYSGGKHVLSGTSGNVFKGTQTIEPASTVVAPAQHSTGTKSRKRKKMPVSVESDPSILNSLQQTEVVVSPLVSISTPVPITAAPGSLTSNAGTLPSVDSISAVPMNLVSTFPGKKMKSSLQSPIFGGNLVSEVKQRSVLPADTIDKLNEAKMHAEDASALATAAVSHSEYVWKQIEQQRHAGLQPETQGRLASAAVAIAAAAAVAKAAAAAANVAANAAFQAKLMAEEASLPSLSYQGNELHKSNDVLTQGQGTPASVLKGEGAVVSSSPFLSAAREAAKKRVEAATAATKRAENVESIVKAAELASEAVSQAGILVSMGHPPSLNKLVEVGPSNYWRQAQESEKVQPCKVGVLEKETETTSDRGFASPSTAHTELDGSVRAADGLGLVSATGKKTNGQKGHISADVAKHTAVVFEPEVGSKSSIDTQTESEQIMKKTNDECIKEGSHVEVFKEGPELRTAWYSANVLSLEDGKAYVLFSDLSVEQGTDKLKEWVALKGEGDEAPKIRTARSITALPYEGTRKRRRAAIGDPVWKIGDRVDSWVHDSWLEGVITEKNKNDENTVTVHFPAQGETLTIKAWNLRPSLVWKYGRWIECSTSGENICSSHEGDTPKEKRPRLGAPSPVAEGKDTKMETVVDPDLGKPPQTGVLDLGVSETTFNIGRKEGNPGPLRMKRTGLQTQGAKVIYGVPKPGKTRKFMDVSKHYISEASNQTRKQKEPAKAVKPIVPQNPGPGSWRLPSKPREKQTTTTTKPKTFKPAPKTKEKPVAAPRIIPRKDSRSTTSSNMESEDAVGQSGENKGPASTSRDPAKGTGEEQITSSSQQGQDTCSQSSTTGKGKVAPTAGRLAKIEEAKALDDNSSKTSDGMEPRRSVRRIQPTSRLLEGLQTSMMTSKIPSMSHSRSHQSQRKK
ncbi:mucin-17-like isoform X2 [Brassica napus]|uniref:mucin-17-like isoform X2 n=1 Tax=Brassica napus TaxID=3708 RepID=UPI002078B282|nr:mucin-17-like isoform X2 [Brassica napus]